MKIKKDYIKRHVIFATFNAREQISNSTVVRTVQRFIETGVKDRLRSGQPTSASNDEKSATEREE